MEDLKYQPFKVESYEKVTGTKLPKEKCIYKRAKKYCWTYKRMMFMEQQQIAHVRDMAPSPNTVSVAAIATASTAVSARAANKIPKS